MGPPVSDPAAIINGLNRLEPTPPPLTTPKAGQHDALVAQQSSRRYSNNAQHKDRAMEMEIQQVQMATLLAA